MNIKKTYYRKLKLDRFLKETFYLKPFKNNRKWKKQKRLYGFDSRQVWNVNTSLFIHIYLMLQMYIDEANIDLLFHEFELKTGEMKNQKEILNIILSDIEEYIDKMNNHLEHADDLFELKENIFYNLNLIFDTLWW